ncbi:MAG: RagB/SusD family nutrient uptake outer membrane protein [Bacteroidales bacterium]|nr:RagB/SusD family nutrient uptake outer membrane protein [Bacteroidales bacterium]
MKKLIYMVMASAVMSLTACDKFLDVMPDNRTEIDSADKMRALLVSAYPETDYMLLSEFVSDDVDDFGETNPNSDRFIQQVYNWQEITETNNEDVEKLWGNTYLAIAVSNQVIDGILSLDESSSDNSKKDLFAVAAANNLLPEMAEALLCRAYNHFILVNMFCQQYNTLTSDKDLGITYMDMPEQGLNPKYKRSSVKEIYDHIADDLALALPYVSDEYFTVPKYHFNKTAAYAFAARFYLYYEKWDESLRYADLCLGSEPSALLRDWADQSKMTQDEDVITEHFIDAGVKSNLLLMTAYSCMGMAFRNYFIYARYSHGNYQATNEDAICLATMLGSNSGNFYKMPPAVYSATNMDRVIFWKLPYLFEYTDPVAQIGYRRTVYPAFTGDMVLLERAEAKILLGKYDEAAADMNIWLNNISKTKWDLTPESINDLFKKMEYYKWDNSTPKKALNPKFDFQEGIQENMLHFVLLLKKVEGLGLGTRWFDVKRYGIEIVRREMGPDGNPLKLLDVLKVDDPRRALQIPVKVSDAGYEKNPRGKSTDSEYVQKVEREPVNF